MGRRKIIGLQLKRVDIFDPKRNCMEEKMARKIVMVEEVNVGVEDTRRWKAGSQVPQPPSVKFILCLCYSC